MHFLTIVIGDDPEEQLERCQENFDWYQFGGRWRGHLILKPGRSGRDLWFGVPTTPAHGWAAPTLGRVRAGRAGQAAKGDVDFTAMAAKKFADLMSDWDMLEERGAVSDAEERQRFYIPESCRTWGQFEAYARRHAQHCAPSAVVHGGKWFGPWWLSDEPMDIAAEKWDDWY
jgi:hypothetical protein